MGGGHPHDCVRQRKEIKNKGAVAGDRGDSKGKKKSGASMCTNRERLEGELWLPWLPLPRSWKCKELVGDGAAVSNNSRKTDLAWRRARVSGRACLIVCCHVPAEYGQGERERMSPHKTPSPQDRSCLLRTNCLPVSGLVHAAGVSVAASHAVHALRLLPKGLGMCLLRIGRGELRWGEARSSSVFFNRPPLAACRAPHAS